MPASGLSIKTQKIGHGAIMKIIISQKQIFRCCSNFSDIWTLTDPCPKPQVKRCNGSNITGGNETIINFDSRH